MLFVISFEFNTTNYTVWTGVYSWCTIVKLFNNKLTIVSSIKLASKTARSRA